MRSRYFIPLSLYAGLALLVGVVVMSFAPVPRGHIDGYVFPRLAKPYVEISIPKANGDTNVRRADVDARGYFKLANVPAGIYTLEYWPKNPAFISQSKSVTVNPDQTTFTDSVRLRRN